MPERLNLLYVSHMPPSPPRFGAQARVHGLMTSVAREHDITAVILVDPDFDLEESRRALAEYCREVVLIPNPKGAGGANKRWLQLRSLASLKSFDRLRVSLPETQRALDRLLKQQRFDVVNLEFPYLAHLRFRQAPPGAREPAVVLDTHEIAYDLARQMAGREVSAVRRVYGSANWPKLQREERAAFRMADGLCACSEADRDRLWSDAPGARIAVIPNAADVDYFQPRPTDPVADGYTVVFFGMLQTFPNLDGVRHLVHDIWPHVRGAEPRARLKIIGKKPPPEVQALAAPDIEITGFVEDLRPHLASAQVIVVPLRFGGGTRLKIVEAMAMGRAIVSTTLGAEGIDAKPERDILISDDPKQFADGIVRLIKDREFAASVGRAGRELAVARYSWRAAGDNLVSFFREVLLARNGAS
jgi:polysaccharide biosynthesis protein PslH